MGSYFEASKAARSEKCMNKSDSKQQPPPYNPNFVQQQQPVVSQPQPPPPQQTVVVVQQQGLLAGLGSASAYLNCPNCQAEICTRVDGSVKTLGWVFCLLCGLFPGLLALCMNGFKKFTHSCPRCNMIIGTGEPPFTTGEKWCLAVSILLPILAAIAYVIIVVVVGVGTASYYNYNYG